MSSVPAKLPIYASITDKSNARIDDFIDRVKKLSPVPKLFQRAQSARTSDKPTLENEERILAYGFLSARRWNVKEAVKMIVAAEELYNYLYIFDLNFFPSPFSIRGFDEQELLRQLNLHPRIVVNEEEVGKVCRIGNAYSNLGFHYWDKRGLPVVYCMLSHVDVRLMYKKGRQQVPVGESLSDFVVRYFIYMVETAFGLCRYQDIKLAKENPDAIDTGAPRRNFITLVVDAKGVSDDVVYKPVMNILMEVIEKLKVVSPDCIHRVVVVNCTSTLRFTYNIVKPAIDERMQKKIAFVDSDKSLDVLERVIGLEHVPKFLGGKCECSGGCIANFNPDAKISSCETENDVVTEYIKIGPHDKLKRAFEVKKGESVFWDFTSVKGENVVFSLYFYPTQDGMSLKSDSSKVVFDKSISSAVKSNGLIKTEKMNDGTDRYDAEEDGFLQLVWDNSSSLISSKQIQMRVYKGPTPHKCENNREHEDHSPPHA